MGVQLAVPLHFTLLNKTYVNHDVKILNVPHKIIINETQCLILSLDWPMKDVLKPSAKLNGLTSYKPQQWQKSSVLLTPMTKSDKCFQIFSFFSLFLK